MAPDRTEHFIPKEWDSKIDKFYIMCLFNVPHSVASRVLLVVSGFCFRRLHVGYLWLDHAYPVYLDTLGLPQLGEDLAEAILARDTIAEEVY